jgi:hypothetical protein
VQDGVSLKIVFEDEMSRSKRKSPFTGLTAAKTEKPFKQHSSRALRKAQKSLLAKTDPDFLLLPTKGRELMNVYSSTKEGKRRLDLSHPSDRKRLRK